MQPDQFLNLIRVDATRLADVAGRDLDAPVPCCPGWVARDVLLHTAEVYQHKIACMRLQRDPDPWPPEWTIDDPVAWFAASAAELLSELQERGPAAPAYTWHKPEQTVGFWLRRMAQETAVHRVDAELAAGEPGSVDSELALDGVDEVLDIFVDGDWSDLPQPGPKFDVRLRAADRTWLVRLRPESVHTVQEPSAETTPAAIVTGAPSDLLLWLWGRLPVDVLSVVGDDAAVAALRHRLSLATQ